MLTPSGVLHLQKIESFHCRFSCWRVPSILYIPHPFKKASSLFVVILRAHFLCIPRFFGWLELEVDSCQNTWAVNIGSSLFFKEHLETHPLAELVVCVWETHFLARPCLWYFDDSLHYVFRWCESCTLLLHHRMTIFFLQLMTRWPVQFHNSGVSCLCPTSRCSGSSPNIRSSTSSPCFTISYAYLSARCGDQWPSLPSNTRIESVLRCEKPCATRILHSELFSTLIEFPFCRCHAGLHLGKGCQFPDRNSLLSRLVVAPVSVLCCSLCKES